MKGSYHIIVANRYLKYEFDIRRNLTLIQGNSATGKTTLIDMIRESALEKKSGITISCKKRCRVLEGDLWKEQLQFIKDSILFIDEGSSFVETEEFATAVKNSNNYYVIVTRENLEMLPISVEEVYGIHSSGKYGSLEPVYHEMYHIYQTDQKRHNELPIKPQILLIEDSNAGYEFYADISQKRKLGCFSAEGKSNIFYWLINNLTDAEVLVIADGAAFASQMNKILHLMENYENLHLYLPESFEQLLLKSAIQKDSEVEKILRNPCDYIESSEYFSWERFFTKFLIEKTQGTYLQYQKNKLNSNYLHDGVQTKVMEQMEGIEL